MAKNNAIDIDIETGGGNTYTFPSATSTLATLDLAETLTNKDLSDASNTLGSANVEAAGALMESEVTNLAQVKAFDSTDYAAALGVDDNYVTDAEKTVIGNTSGTNTGDQDLTGLATKANVLELDNTTSFTPDADYEPATKKYVDDNAGGGPDVQTFTSSGTWTKPVGATFALVEIYAGGGSGGASVEDYSASTGGAGGQYISALIVGSSLTSTVSVTVGDGGALVTAVEYPATIDGIDGGDSSFGTYVVGIGGQGGNAVGGSSEITAPGATAGAGTDFDGLLYANESGENSSSAPATAASSRVASSDGGEAGPADNKSLGGAGVSSNSSATATAGETPGAGGGGVATRGGPAISGAGGGGKVVITSF